MPGSRTQIPVVLLYNNSTDTARWEQISIAHRLVDMAPTWEIIELFADNYNVIAAMAGPQPEAFHQEITQVAKQGD